MRPNVHIWTGLIFLSLVPIGDVSDNGVTSKISKGCQIRSFQTQSSEGMNKEHSVYVSQK